MKATIVCSPVELTVDAVDSPYRPIPPLFSRPVSLSLPGLSLGMCPLQ